MGICDEFAWLGFAWLSYEESRQGRGGVIYVGRDIGAGGRTYAGNYILRRRNFFFFFFSKSDCSLQSKMKRVQKFDVLLAFGEVARMAVFIFYVFLFFFLKIYLLFRASRGEKKQEQEAVRGRGQAVMSNETIQESKNRAFIVSYLILAGKVGGDSFVAG